MSNVLYLSPYFWPEEIGSAPYCTEFAAHLASRGHDVKVVAFRPHYPSIEPFSNWASGARDKETSFGVSIERVAVNARGSGGFKDRLRNDIRFLTHMLKAVTSGRLRKTDLIVAYVPSVLTLYGAMVVRLFTRAPIFAVVHDIESGLANSLGITKSRSLLKLMRLVERIGLNSAQTVVVLTEGMLDELRHLGCKRQIKVISIWAAISKECTIDPERSQVLMYSGNFGKKQNIDQLFPILARLSQERKGVQVIMRGGGSERDRIEAEMEARKISNVQFLPLVPAEELIDSLQSANIHLVPQAANVANYALPSKLFSIMAAGRPFICIAQPGSPMHHIATSSGAGLCVPPESPDELYAAITDLLSDTARQIELGRKGQDYIRTYMNRDKILTEFEELLFEQVQNKKG